MSFHHTRRLTEHWPDNTKDLSPAVKLVATTITNHLNAKTDSFSISAKSLTKWTNGLSRSTIDKAVKQLADLGVLEVVRERQRAPRAFRLLVECPQGCERLKDHNTKLERSRQIQTQKAPETAAPEETSSSRLDNEFLQIGQRVPPDKATNRYPINTLNKKDDMKESFEYLFITETLEALKTSNQYTANHALLSKALLEIPELIEERARAIQERATHSPHKYLLNSITNSPTSLIPKQETPKQETESHKWKKQVAAADHNQRIKSQYKALWESYLELDTHALNDDPTIGALTFMRNVCPKDLNITAARIANKASYYGVKIGHCKTVGEAGELTAVHPDLPPRDIQYARAKEAREKYFKSLENKSETIPEETPEAKDPSREQDLDLAVAALARSRALIKEQS
jgi:DNA-binding transcriptional ArsR family regulator